MGKPVYTTDKPSYAKHNYEKTIMLKINQVITSIVFFVKSTVYTSNWMFLAIQ